MNTKKLLVSFLAIASVLFLAASVSASDITSDYAVEIEGIDPYTENISVIAGETISVEVWFTADEYDSDVTVEAELEGEKVDTNAISNPFDVEEGKRYRNTLSIRVPYELKDELSDKLELTIEIDGKEYKTVLDEIILGVQRPTYNADIKSVGAPQSIDAGESFPVELVLKNIGYNDLDDLYVTVSIPALGLESSAYFGDIVALECDDDEDYNSGQDDDDVLPWGEATLGRNCDEDDEDTVMGRLFLEVPYNVQAGIYTLEVEVENDDTTSSVARQIVIENDFETNVFVSGNDLWVVNPTDNVVGYRVVPESPASVSESIVFVPAGSSKTITVSPNTEGAYGFDVNVFTMTGELVQTVSFTGEAEEPTAITNPIVILTVILAIIFLVLLIVLIVLIGKKPEKSEEFGESYY